MTLVESHLLEILSPGDVVDDNYEIIHLIGQGGAAQVYKARHLALDTPVAIKLLRPDISSEAVRLDQERRLWNEARAVAKIHHPNIVRVRGIKRTLTYTSDGKEMTLQCPFMVLDFLEGASLARVLAVRGAMAPERALPLFLACLEGLAEAHGQGVIHKDLKPDNLFLAHYGTPRERLVILDFGTARMGEQMTREGQMPFTPNYVAPEYISGHTVTQALDVYQMGLVLIEMLTGHAAVPHNELVACLMAHKLGRLEVPEWLWASPVGPILKSATASAYEERIQTAAIFHKVLSRIEPSTLRPPP